MGRRDRLRKELINKGLEVPIAVKVQGIKPVYEKVLTCRKCHVSVVESRARAHIRECWHYPIKDDEPIPEQPIVRRLP